MKQQILLLCLACLTGITTATAQSSAPEDDSSLKAAYLDLGQTLFLKSMGGGLTFVTQKNWLISGHLYSLAEKDASQKPGDFKPSKKITSGGGGGSSGTFNLDLNLFGGNNAPSTNDPNIIYRLRTLTAGKIFGLPVKNLRLRTEAGVAFLKINEAVDFVFVPRTEVTDPVTNVTTVTTEGYTFSREEYRKTGACVRLVVEFPFLKYVGLNAMLEGTFAKNERLFGLSLGLMLGVVK